MRYLGGIDIGGTKCAVTLGCEDESNNITILDKEKFPTPHDPHEAVAALVSKLDEIVKRNGMVKLSAVGVSCGSPLDSKKGVILCPPNLPNWDNIDVVTPFEEKFSCPAAVQNDANACALAEWRWGAGRGTENMIFLTFGTGLGAGLILNGRLYSGTNDMAGEVGHIRISPDGPLGYGKRGSFEGWCSGGGIARGGAEMLKQWLADGKETSLSSKSPENLTAADIGKAAEAGDELANEIMKRTGRMLGQGIAILCDILNPERIVIGSIFLRQEKLLRAPMQEILAAEALSYTAGVCEVVPAALGESLGDYAALSVAADIKC